MSRKGRLLSVTERVRPTCLGASGGKARESAKRKPQERMVLDVLLKEQLPVIYLADNGFDEYYKPSALLFDAVAAGRLLIFSPWQYDPAKRHIARSECVALNNFASVIASSR